MHLFLLFFATIRPPSCCIDLIGNPQTESVTAFAQGKERFEQRFHLASESFPSFATSKRRLVDGFDLQRTMPFGDDA